ncbi:HAMP domain-containing protein [Azospirillum sp. sgz301742]
MTTVARPPQRTFAATLSIAVLLAALLTMIGVGLFGVVLARKQLGEVRATKGAAVAEAVRRDLARALGHGIPLERIEGVGPYLQGVDERNADLGFLAVTGREGVVLHESGIGRDALERLAATLLGTAEPPVGSTGALPVERDGFLIVRLPLSAPSAKGPAKGHEIVGHVLVGVRSEQTFEQNVRDGIPVLLGIAAMLLLLAPVAAATVRGTLGGPLDRLARRMTAAAQGDFGTLIDRRPRDQMGRVQLAFNAVVFRVHDRRQRFAAQADEVSHAVFDPEVAQEVERTRQRTLEALGPGLATPPRRVADASIEDGGAFMAISMAAVVAAVLAADPLGAWVAVPAPWPGLLTAAAAGGGVVGLALRHARVRAGGGSAVVLRAAAAGGGAAALWGAALGWDSGALAVTALVLALAGTPLARSFVPLRR